MCRKRKPHAIEAENYKKERTMPSDDKQETIPTTPVKGYRQLTQPEIDMMNEGKTLAQSVGDFVDKVRAADFGDAGKTDQRWASIGATELQKGFMALLRAIARPETF
jgi:hypothetical protein